MKTISFPQANLKIAESQDEYRTIPARREASDPNGVVTFCWKLSWKDVWGLIRNKGVIWQQVMTFKQPLQPQLMQVEMPQCIAIHGAHEPMGPHGPGCKCSPKPKSMPRSNNHP